MGSRSALIGLGIGAYLAAVIALAPAAAAYRWFAPPTVLAAGLDGSVWRGRAALVSIGPVGLYAVEWSMSPWTLLTGRVSLQLQARHADGFIRAHISAGLGNVRLTDVQASGSLSSIGQFLPLGDIRGLLSIQLASVELDDGWPVSAAGQVRLAQLETPLLLPGGPSGLIPLGNYLILLSNSGSAGLTGQFEDQGGPLQVSGTFGLAIDRTYELSGTVRARDDAPEEIVQGLQFVTGAPDDGGRRPFELSGSL